MFKFDLKMSAFQHIQAAAENSKRSNPMAETVTEGRFSKHFQTGEVSWITCQQQIFDRKQDSEMIDLVT